MIYTIGEMAKQLGVAPSTLRYYDKEGLLPFVERSAGGMRMFKDADYEVLNIISCLKATGMQLKEIRKFIFLAMEGDGSIDACLELFEKRREEVERQMEQLRETLETIHYKCWYYECAKRAGTTQVPAYMSDDELPDEYRAVRARLHRNQVNLG